MPDRTHPSGLMNLRDPYDTENYYSEEFMQKLNKALGLVLILSGVNFLEPHNQVYLI